MKTFKEWMKMPPGVRALTAGKSGIGVEEMAGTGAIYDGDDSVNWWGAVGVDKGDYKKKPLETDVNHPKKHKKHKRKDK